MKRFLTVIWYGTLPVLSLIWAVGCSTSPTGGAGGAIYSLEAFIQPPAIAVGGTGIVHCFFRYGDSLLSGQTIKIRATSGQQSSYTSSVFSSDTAATGTYPVIYYNPNAVIADADTIYVHAPNSVQDTIAIDTVFVTILHP
mgnify:CR=1 FL=1